MDRFTKLLNVDTMRRENARLQTLLGEAGCPKELQELIDMLYTRASKAEARVEELQARLDGLGDIAVALERAGQILDSSVGKLKTRATGLDANGNTYP